MKRSNSSRISLLAVGTAGLVLVTALGIWPHSARALAPANPGPLPDLKPVDGLVSNPPAEGDTTRLPTPLPEFVGERGTQPPTPAVTARPLDSGPVSGAPEAQILKETVDRQAQLIEQLKAQVEGLRKGLDASARESTSAAASRTEPVTTTSAVQNPIRKSSAPPPKRRVHSRDAENTPRKHKRASAPESAEEWQVTALSEGSAVLVNGSGDTRVVRQGEYLNHAKVLRVDPDQGVIETESGSIRYNK